MNKHLDKAKEFLGIMKEMLSEKKGECDVAHLKDRIAMQEWLIEQAERVQELEKELLYYKMATESYVDMEQQNKRYREALEQIANSRVTIADGVGNIRIAQRALRGETDEC